MRYPAIRYISIISHAMPFIAGLIHQKRCSNPLRMFFLFICIALLAEWSEYILQCQRVQNIWILQIYILISTVVLLAMYGGWLYDREFAKLVIWLLNCGFVIFWFCSKFLFEGIYEPPLYTLNLSNILLIGITLLMLITFMRDGTENLGNDARFWVSIGLLIFAADNLIPFLLISASIGFSQNDAITLWLIPWWMSTIANCCYTWAFVCLPRG